MHEQLDTRSHDSMQHEGAARKARAHGLRLQLGRLLLAVNVSVATSKSAQRGASVCASASASARAPRHAEAAARLRSGFSVARCCGGKLGGRRDARCRVGDASRRVRVAERDGDIAPTEAAQRQALQLAALGQHGSHALGGQIQVPAQVNAAQLAAVAPDEQHGRLGEQRTAACVERLERVRAARNGRKPRVRNRGEREVERDEARAHFRGGHGAAGAEVAPGIAAGQVQMAQAHHGLRDWGGRRGRRADRQRARR